MQLVGHAIVQFCDRVELLENPSGQENEQLVEALFVDITKDGCRYMHYMQLVWL